MKMRLQLTETSSEMPTVTVTEKVSGKSIGKEMATEKSNAVVTEKATVTTTVKETLKALGKATATTTMNETVDEIVTATMITIMAAMEWVVAL